MEVSRSKAALGERWPVEYVNGRPMVSWSDGNSEDELPRGYYPLNEDGSIDSAVRLRLVDDQPTEPDGNAHHFEVMPRRAGVGYYHGVPESKVVPLEAEAKGKSTTNAGRRKLP